MTDYEFFKKELKRLQQERQELINAYIAGEIEPRKMIKLLNKLDKQLGTWQRRVNGK